MTGQRPAENRLLVAYDATLLVIVITLVIVGLLSVYSATVHLALPSGNPAIWFKRQLMWAVLGTIVMIVVSRIRYTYWRRVALPLLGLTLLLLATVLFLPSRFGSARFLLGKSVQPSEVAKFALVIYAATWLTGRRDKLHDVSYGLIPFSVIIGFVAGIVALQPDLGTAMLLGAVGLIMFFIAGADIKQFMAATTIGGVTFALLVLAFPHARKRIEDLIAVWKDPDAYHSDQLSEALRVMREGGILGRGPGALDHPFTAVQHDFILSAVGNAFGLVGLTVVLALFGVLAYRGYSIAAHAPDAFGSFAAAGMTTWLILQALINMGVAVALFPPTGIPLPFISYGGSSMLMSMAAIGVLLNISQYVPTRSEHATTHVGRGYGGTRVSRSERI